MWNLAVNQFSPRRLQIDLDPWPYQLAGERRTVEESQVFRCPLENAENIGSDPWSQSTNYHISPLSLRHFKCLFLNPYSFHHFILHQVTITRCPQLCEDRRARVNRFVGGLPLCGLAMLRCLNSTKIHRRWQCGAQCRGPCLRTAPVPLTPTSLGQPSAVFGSVCSTRDHANLREYYVTVIMHYPAADWFQDYINFPVIKLKSH